MKIEKLFKTKNVPLIFSIICGLSYFVIITRFILTYTSKGGSLLAFFFFPAITCGMALFIFKTIKAYLESNAAASLKVLFYTHILIIIISIATLIEWITV
ncbi:MAG: hypothetical protein J6N52_14560 [Clostridia bacterium]|nr:hypothetical protein [Clostridia bacterium]